MTDGCSRTSDRWGRYDIITHIVETARVPRDQAEAILENARINTPDKQSLIVSRIGTFALLTTHNHPDKTPIEIIYDPRNPLGIDQVISPTAEEDGSSPAEVWDEFCADMEAHRIILSRDGQITQPAPKQGLLTRLRFALFPQDRR